MARSDEETVSINGGPEMKVSEFHAAVTELGADKRLRAIVDELVGLHEQVKEIKDEIKAAEESAKLSGYNKPALKRVVKHRLMTPEQINAEEELQEAVDRMNHALGDWRATPLARASSDDE